MSYKRTEKYKNGDWEQALAVFECDRCGAEQEPGWPRIHLKNVDICHDCLIAYVAEFLQLNSGGIARFLIAETLEKYRYKRSQIPKKVRQEIFKTFKTECPICAEKDSKKLSIDHILPVSRGGSHDISNLRILCKSCNSRKGNRI